MDHKSSVDPVRIGNPNNLKFRSLGDMNQDIIPIIAQNIRQELWELAVKESENELHRGELKTPGQIEFDKVAIR